MRAGLALLDQVGLEGLTLRAIAAELGVQAPSLYWRFRNKQDLIEEMAAQVVTGYAAILAAAPDRKSWPAWAHLCGTALRGELRRRRDGARMVAGAPGIDTAMAQGLDVFKAAGVTEPDAVKCLRAVADHALGFTIVEQSAAGDTDDAAYEYGLQLIIAGFAASLPLGTRAWLEHRSFKSGPIGQR